MHKPSFKGFIIKHKTDIIIDYPAYKLFINNKLKLYCLKELLYCRQCDFAFKVYVTNIICYSKCINGYSMLDIYCPKCACKVT